MTEAAESRDRHQSRGEEIANSISHGIGLLAGLVAVPVLVVAAVERGDVAGIVGASVFAATIVMLYLASTLYHALPRNKAKRVMRIVDHCAIFLLIAGSYTPFMLGALRGPWGWTLLGLVWGLGLAGITLKTLRGARHPNLSLALYLGTGWLIVIAAKPLILNISPWGLFWLVAGGAAYTAGVVFYALDRFRYMHFVWHLWVLAGTTCHFFAVMWYAA